MTQRTILLDTNILLCALIAPERLNADIQAQLSDAENSVYFSAASLWEIAIKSSLNKADFNFSPEDIHKLAIETGFIELGVQAQHTYAIANMTWHHRDPFDRILIAQTLSLPAYLLTSDGVLTQYSELVQLTVLKSS
ncbi:MAG: type II toxin-antitoxin system VapC family toxin [Methylophilaceae bacterium]